MKEREGEGRGETASKLPVLQLSCKVVASHTVHGMGNINVKPHFPQD